jgi:hypothetical protein
MKLAALVSKSRLAIIMKDERPTHRPVHIAYLPRTELFEILHRLWHRRSVEAHFHPTGIHPIDGQVKVYRIGNVSFLFPQQSLLEAAQEQSLDHAANVHVQLRRVAVVVSFVVGVFILDRTSGSCESIDTASAEQEQLIKNEQE